MTAIHARSAFLDGRWTDDVRLILADAEVSTIERGAAPRDGDERVDALVPAMPNLHSHAFQRAMAGLAERRGPGTDSFWSWRTVMYRLALAMTPEHVEAVAAQSYMEMLEAGFGRVGEFHYLHHDRDGTPHDDPAELAGRVMAAGVETGIGMTLMPAFYAHSGFGGGTPTPGQRRFVHSLDAYGRLVGECRRRMAAVPGGVIGVAPHSLRAVTAEELAVVVRLGEGGPVHIHVAEQVGEVEDCLAWTGARPVQWLLDHAAVDGRWCLVHATHMTDAESRRMIATGAVAGLCPITEANLGDGIFPIGFLRDGGAFGVGSDSNVAVSLPAELRQLEYSQRLSSRTRNAIAAPGDSTGEALFTRALAGGSRALGVAGGIVANGSADLVALDLSAVPYLPRDAVLDHWVFAGGLAVDQVWVRGRRVVRDGRHVRRKSITERFNRTMADLVASY